MNNDFYSQLPEIVCIILDGIIMDYSSEPWFEEAWEEYRQHVLNTDMDNVRMPWFIFGKYVEEK